MSANQVQKRPSASVVRGALHLAASPRLPGARLVSRKWPLSRLHGRTVNEDGITPTRARLKALRTHLSSRAVETPSVSGRGHYTERGSTAPRQTLQVPRPAPRLTAHAGLGYTRG